MMTFGQLAKRLSAWTSRGIVSAVILVAGLAFGRQVLQWWGMERQAPTMPPQASLALGALGDSAQEHLLEFGDSAWRMSRRVVVARDHDVLRELQARCEEVIRSCSDPKGEPGPAERDFLNRVANDKPAREEAGKWRLHALDAAFPMVIGTRPTGPTRGPPNDRVVKPHQRVVTWGLAVPAGANSWIVYTFHVAPPKGEYPAVLPELPIPPGSRPGLAIRAADGGAVVSFKGPERPGEWRQFFDSWLSSHGWGVADAWQYRGTTWSLRCIREAGDRCDSLDVFLSSDGTGEMTGLVLLAPLSGALSKGERP
jgi:hypothetical protein